MSPLSLCFSDSGPRKFVTLTSSLNEICVKKVKKQTNKQKTISWSPKNLNPAELIDVLLFNRFPCQKYLFSQSADKQPEFDYIH